MSKLIISITLFAVCVFSEDSDSADWSYEEDEPLGPSHWTDAYKMCGHGKQSPIDISEPKLDNDLGEFSFLGYDDLPRNVRVRHDGHTVKVFPDITMTITGGSLNNTFTFHHLHFHWGDNDTLGSEHTVDGVTYPLEMHFVHWNSDKYNNISDASPQDDGLAVIGLFVKVDSDNSTRLNKALGHLTKSFAVIHFVGNETRTTPFKFKDLFPHNLQYYRYQGSLTTPPCLESVTWTVLRDPVYVTHDQAEEFRRFHEEHHPDLEIHHSNRPTQARNNRNIFLSRPFQLAQMSSRSSGTNSVRYALLAYVVVMIMILNI